MKKIPKPPDIKHRSYIVTTGVLSSGLTSIGLTSIGVTFGGLIIRGLESYPFSVYGIVRVAFLSSS